MSTIIVLSVMLPATAAAWPVVATAAAAAASAMGFAALKGQAEVNAEAGSSVEIQVANSEAVTENMALGEDLVFVRDDIQVVFSRDVDGKIGVMVHGERQSKQELKAIGEELTQKLVQQYAYHRVVTELKNRDFSMVDQQVEDDGTVRLKVRTYQG